MFDVSSIMQSLVQTYRADDAAAHFAFGRLTDVASFAFDRVNDRGTKVRFFLNRCMYLSMVSHWAGALIMLICFGASGIITAVGLSFSFLRRCLGPSKMAFALFIHCGVLSSYQVSKQYKTQTDVAHRNIF